MNSPSYLKGRTFTIQFILPDFSNIRKTKHQKVYQNPIYKAMEWQEMLDKGQFKSKAELGRHFGVSRVRVVQMLNLLKLETEVIEKLKAAGKSFNKKILGEKTLRRILVLDSDKQIKKITEIFEKDIYKLK